MHPQRHQQRWLYNHLLFRYYHQRRLPLFPLPLAAPIARRLFSSDAGKPSSQSPTTLLVSTTRTTTTAIPSPAGSGGSHRRRSSDNKSKSNDSSHQQPPQQQKVRPDPFARRPTKKCDPYGQGGKPLSLDKVRELLQTVEPDWKIMLQEQDTEHNNNNNNNKLTATTTCTDNNNSNDDDDTTIIPFGITRLYEHFDTEYRGGAHFIQTVATVAEMQADYHYPYEMKLHRRLNTKTKRWTVCTQIICRTHVLQGLSHHDFYLATVIDIEMNRKQR